MKIKDIYREYADTLKPDGDLLNSIEKRAAEKKNENLFYVEVHSVEHRRAGFNIIAPLALLVSMLFTASLALSLLRNDDTDNKLLETDISKESSVSEISSAETFSENVFVNSDLSETSILSIEAVVTDITETYDLPPESAHTVPPTAESIKKPPETIIAETTVFSETSTEETTTPEESEDTRHTDNTKYDSCFWIDFDDIRAESGQDIILPIKLDESYSPYVMLAVIDCGSDAISVKNIKIPDEYSDKCSVTKNLSVNYIAIVMESPENSGIEFDIILHTDENIPSGKYEINIDIENATGNGSEWNFINICGNIEIL